MIDIIDRQMLTILQSDARTSNAEIARRVDLAPSAIHARLQKLEEAGLIEHYSARLAPRPLGFGLTAFIFVRAEERPASSDAALALAELPQVLEVHHIAGEDCYLVKARFADTDALAAFLGREIGMIPSITSTKTTIVLNTHKETSALALDSVTGNGGDS